MRLRLTVQRNALPAANILWNVPDTNSNTAYTITRLLEDVHHIMPLEADNWGLEDYAVEVGGFECLHFTPVTQALKEDDHVCIRPLMTAEVRARTLTGRLQISDGGQHLVDGVPFGRPYLRTPHRPAVRIPPRKRQRADQQEADDAREARNVMNALLEGTSDGPTQQQIEDAPGMQDPSESARSIPPHKRQRLNPTAEAEVREARDAMDSVLAALDDPSQRKNGHRGESSSSRTLHGSAAQQPMTKRQRQQAKEREEDMAMTNYLMKLLGPPPDDAAKGSMSQAPQHTNPAPWGLNAGRPRQNSRQVHFKQPIAEELGGSDEDKDDEDDEDFAPGTENNDDWDSDDDSSDRDSDSGDSSSGSDSTHSGSDSDSSSGSDSDNGSDVSSPPDILSSKDGSKKPTTPTKPASPVGVPPGGGRSATKSRNSRRTRTNRLRHLKELGLLNENATLADLHAYEDAKRGDNAEEKAPAHPFSIASGKRKRIDDGDAHNTESRDVSELEQRKQELMARLGDSPNGAVLADEPALSASTAVIAPEFSRPETTNEEQSAKKDTPTRRMRPDTSAISRILARQAARPAKKTKTKPVYEGPPEPEGASDPEFWKSRINLSAFECWEEEYELSAPPFPFKQHWDPASKLMRDKKHKGKKRGNKPGPATELPQSEDEEEKIVLNYEDAPVEDNPDIEISAAIEDQLRQDVATATQEADVPPLPEDVSTLPELISADIREGAIIVCKFFAVNPITITPEISDYKTAVVEKEGDSGNGAGTIQLKIAARDLPQREKKFDKHGNRIYDAGAAFLMEDEGEEEGLWEGQFGELLEAKLLKAAEA